MTIKELREKAARAVAQAQELHKAHSANWTPENQVEYDQFIAEFSAAQKEIKTLEQVEQNARFISDNAGLLNPNPPPQAPVNTGQPSEANRRQAHMEAFRAYVRRDSAGLGEYINHQQLMAPKELFALVSNDATLGGFTVPEDVRSAVLKAEAGYAVLVPLCRTENTNRDALVFPKIKPHATDGRRTSGFAGTWRNQGYVTGGTAPTVQNQPTFQRERIPVHSWQPDAVEISPELLEDSAANIEQIVAEAIGEALGFDKDDAILNGGGENEPEGILQAGVTTVATTSATALTYAGLINLFTNLPAQYRQGGTFVMASKTMGEILKLNTGTGGMYLFPPNNWNNTILTRPVVFLDYGMDEADSTGAFTAADKPIIFGDWKKYIIAQRRDLRIQRLIERFAPNVGLLPTARIGGQVVMTDAFRIQTCAAS